MLRKWYEYLLVKVRLDMTVSVSAAQSRRINMLYDVYSTQRVLCIAATTELYLKDLGRQSVSLPQ